MEVQVFKKESSVLTKPNKPNSNISLTIQQKPDFRESELSVVFSSEDQGLSAVPEGEEDEEDYEGGTNASIIELCDQIYLDDDGNIVKVEDFNLKQSFLFPEDNFWTLICLRLSQFLLMALVLLIWLTFHSSSSFVWLFFTSHLFSFLILTPLCISLI